MSKYGRFKKRCEKLVKDIDDGKQAAMSDIFTALVPNYDNQQYYGRLNDLASDIARSMIAVCESAYNDGQRAAKDKAANAWSEVNDAYQKGRRDAAGESWCSDAFESGRVLPEGLRWPQFPDGEPVNIGSHTEHGTVASVVIGDTSYTLVTEIGRFSRGHGVKVGRAGMAAFDADGVQIKVGDVLYGKYTGRKRAKVSDVYVKDDGEPCVSFEDGSFDKCKLTTHKKPDNQERIDDDVMKPAIAYWGCCDEYCSECPSRIDGESPAKHYGVGSCKHAMVLDLLRRQRELCAKGCE